MASPKKIKPALNIETLELVTDEKVIKRFIANYKFFEKVKTLLPTNTLPIGKTEKKPKVETLLGDIRKNFNFLWTHCEFAASARAFGAPDKYIQDVIQMKLESDIGVEVIDELIVFYLAETMQRLAYENKDAKLKLCMQHNPIDYRVIKAINVLAAIPIEEKLEAEKSRLEKYGGRKKGSIAGHTKYVYEVLQNNIGGANKELWKQLKSAIDSNEATACPLWLDDDVVRFSGKDKEYTFSAFEKTMVNLRKK
jgi:hypothetical protein